MSVEDQKDDGSISDDAGLLRRIHPQQVVPDENRGGFRPSSAAFKDSHMSTDVEPMLIERGEDWNFSIREFPGHSLVRLIAAIARGQNQAVIHCPIAGVNEAHAEVRGKKTQSVSRQLGLAAEWVFLAPQDS